MLAFWIPCPVKTALKIVEIDIARGIDMHTIPKRFMAFLVIGRAKIMNYAIALTAFLISTGYFY